MDIESREQRMAEGSLATALVLQSRYCDLVLASEALPEPPYVLTASDLAGHLALHCVRPVLAGPRIGATRPIGKRIVVPWHGSAEASRAVAAAMPLLPRANAVEVVVCNPARSAGMHGEEPGADLAQYLSLQEIGFNVRVQTDDDVG